jgi:Na+/melibiose symporter-like transporter
MTSIAPERRPMDGPLRLVIVLMFVNLGLSVVLSVLMLILHRSLVDFELAHSHLPPGATPEQIAITRKALESATWGRLVGVLVVSVLYIWRASALRRGSRGAYRRMILICVVGLIGIVYLVAVAQYPVWMRVEQVLQGIVLLTLLYAVTRPAVRQRYAKQPRPV